MKQVLAIRVGAKKAVGCLEEVVTYCTFRFDRRSGRRSPPLHWAGRRWVRTFKRRFGISGRRLPLDEPVSADHVQAKARKLHSIHLDANSIYLDAAFLHASWNFLGMHD